MKRSIEEDDIYAVKNSMRSDQITEALNKLWQLELKKKHPSIIRAILKVSGLKMLIISILHSIGELLARLVLQDNILW